MEGHSTNPEHTVVEASWWLRAIAKLPAERNDELWRAPYEISCADQLELFAVAKLLLAHGCDFVMTDACAHGRGANLYPHSLASPSDGTGSDLAARRSPERLFD